MTFSRQSYYKEVGKNVKRSVWKEIQIIFILFTVLTSYIIATYMAAFDVRQWDNFVLLLTFYGCDLIFFFEGFFRTCKSIGKRAADHKKKSLERYSNEKVEGKSWYKRIPIIFIFDLLSVIPFELLVFLLYPGTFTNVRNGVSFTRKVMTLISLLRLNRILRLYRIFSFYGHKKSQMKDNIMGWEAYAIIISFCAFLIVLFHGVACLWYNLHCEAVYSPKPARCGAESDEFKEKQSFVEGYHHHPFYEHLDANKSDPWGWYVGALHWTVMSLRNSGNKYLLPITPGDILISTFIMIFGFLMCNSIIGVAIYVFSLLDLKRSLFFHNSEAIIFHIEHFNFPRKVKYLVQESFNYIWQRERMFSDSPLKLLLPLHIQKEIGREIFYKMIQKSELLRCLKRNTLDNLGLSVKIRHFVELEFLIRPSSTNYNAYYIINGLVEVLNEDGSSFVILSGGTLIGEMNMVFPYIRRNAVHAITPCEIIVLSYQDLKEHLDNDPVGHAKIIQVILERLNSVQRKKMDIINQHQLTRRKVEKEKSQFKEKSKSKYSAPDSNDRTLEGDEKSYESEELEDLKTQQIHKNSSDEKTKKVQPQNIFNIVNWLAVDKNVKRSKDKFYLNYQSAKIEFHQKAQRSYILSSVFVVPNYSFNIHKLAISKSSYFYIIWDFFMFFIILGQNFLYPVQLAWNMEKFVFSLNYTVDAVYFIDIILQLFIFRYRYEMEPFLPHSTLIIRRLKRVSFFLFDFIPVIPLHYIAYTSEHKMRRILLWRIYICLKFGKILKKLRQMENNIELNTIKVRIFRHAIIMALFTIWLGSIFCIIGCPDYPDCSVKWNTDINSSWVDMFKYHPSTSPAGESTEVEAYQLSIYWAVCTTFGIVFTDINMVTWLETTIHSLGLLIGFILFTYFCADLSATLAGYVEHKMHMKDNLLWIAKFLNQSLIEKNLIRRVSNFLELQWEVLRGHQIEPVNTYGFLQISHSIATELHVHILADALLKTKVFKGVNTDIVLNICKSSRLVVLQPNEFLVCSGDWMRKLYVVRKGIANVYLRDSAIKIDTICNGDVFGLENIIYEIPSLISAKAITYMEIIVIDADIFYSNLRTSPYLLESLNKLKANTGKLVEYSKYFEYPCKEVCEKFDFLIHAKEPMDSSLFKYNSTESFAPAYRIIELKQQVKKEVKDAKYLKKHPPTGWDANFISPIELKKREIRQEKIEELDKDIELIQRELKYLRKMKSGRYDEKKLDAMKNELEELNQKRQRDKNADRFIQRDLHMKTDHPYEFEQHLKSQSTNVKGPGWRTVEEMFVKMTEAERDVDLLKEDIKLLDYQSKEEEYKMYIRPYIQIGWLGFVRYISLPFTFLPQGKFLLRWEIFRVYVILLVMVLLPPILSFPNLRATIGFIIYLTDIIGLIDIYVRFHVAYYEEYSRELITHPLMTSRNYLRSAFITDFLASGPVAYLLDNLLQEYNGLKWTIWVWFLRLNRTLSVYQVFRFRQFKEFHKINIQEGAINLSKVILLCLYHFHFMACVLAILSCPATSSNPSPKPRCENNTWMSDAFERHPPSNPSRGVNCTDIDIYIISLYYYATTSMGCAFGDYGPVNSFERACTTIIIIFHIFILAFIIGSLSGRKSHKDFKLVRYKEQMDYLAMFLGRERIPMPLTRSIIMFYEYQWSRTKGIEPRNLLKSLYPTLRRDTSFSVFEDCFRLVPAFQGVPKEFIRSISIHIAPKYFLRHTLIARKGDICDIIYFMKKGKVSFTHNLSLETILDDGGVIGDIDPDTLYTKYEASAIAVENVDVFVIYKKHYNRIVSSFPKVAERIKMFIKRRNNDLSEKRKREWGETKLVSNPEEFGIGTSLRRAAHGGQFSGQSTGISENGQAVNVNYEEKKTHFMTNKEIFKASERREMKAIRNLNFIVVLASFFSAIFAIYQWAFSEFNFFLFAIGYLSDAIYVVKIIMTFRIGLLSTYGEIITNRPEIKNRYLTDPVGFPLDFMSIFPFEVFVFAFWYAKREMRENPDFIISVWCFLRLNRIIRFFQVVKYFNGLVNLLSVNLTMAKIFRLFAYTAFFIHVLACLLFGITKYIEKPNNCTTDEVGICQQPHAWYQTKSRNLIMLDKEESFNNATYTYTFYFIISTFTTTAYGDMLPVTHFEMLFVTFLSIASRIWVGLTISNILSALQNKTNLTYHMSKDGLVVLYQGYDLSPEIIEKCKMYFRMYWLHNRGVMLPEFLINAPLCLQLDIFAKAYGKHFRRAALFRDVSESFIRQASKFVKHFVVLAGDYIVKRNEIDEFLFFVHIGLVKFSTDEEPEVEESRHGFLAKSSYFGEAQGVFGPRPYKYSYIAKSNCDILALSHKSFEEIFKLFPQYKEPIETRVKKTKVLEEEPIDPALVEYLQIGQQFNKDYNEYPVRGDLPTATKPEK